MFDIILRPTPRGLLSLAAAGLGGYHVTTVARVWIILLMKLITVQEKLTLLSSLTLHSPPSRGPHRLTVTRVPLSAPPSQSRVSQFPSRSPRAHHTVSEDAAPASAPLGQHNFTSRSTEY